MQHCAEGTGATERLSIQSTAVDGTKRVTCTFWDPT